MADFLDSPFSSQIQSNSLGATEESSMEGAQPTPYNEKALLDLFDKLKKESMEKRWVWEREWLRNLYYIMNRQWIYYHPTKREWVDKRLQKWVPRPVTNKIRETLQAIRTMFGSINLSIVARPVRNDSKSVAASEIADDMAPLIHEEHLMEQVMREHDFWFISTGSGCLQVSWDLDKRNNRKFIQHETCQTCSINLPPQELAKTNGTCPQCQGQDFALATDETGAPVGEWISYGKGKTTSLSPFEYAFNPTITRFDDLPYIIRIRWRDRHWFEANHPELIPKITWEKAPSERSLSIFKSLAVSNDLELTSSLSSYGSGGANVGEGVPEYELWLKPTPDFPDGLVMRVIGDQSPMLLNFPEEGLPGPFPYKDIEGTPLFPFVFSQYEHVGGRLYGSSAISPLIQKQDQLNQLDSLTQLIVQRMANPVWLVPEGSGVETYTGEPGLVMKYNPLGVGGNAKPERIGGMEVPGSIYQLRAQIIQDMEDLSGAFDIVKGQKPAGVEAFSALQLLVERSQSRFTSAMHSRGELYRAWFAIAIELERSFGPDERTRAVVGPNRSYTFQHFQNAQLQGSVTFDIEDGSNMPKTALGKRAAIEQANNLGLLDPSNPTQKYALLSNFGLAELDPGLDVHMQAALQMQDEFETWMESPSGPPPLVVKPWMDAQIHWNQRIQWLNTDRMREKMKEDPQIEVLITQHLQQLDLILHPPMPVGPDGAPIPGGPPSGPPGAPKPSGGALAMKNSNQNSGSTGSLPSGNKEVGNNVGPM